MGFALVNSAKSAASTQPALTLDTTGANLLIAHVCAAVNGGPTISDSRGNTWTALTSENGTSEFMSSWYCVPSSVGTGHTITTASGSSMFASLYVSAWSGASATPFDKQAGATLATRPGSITPAANGCLVISGLCSHTAGTYAVDSGFTIAQQQTFVSGTNDGGAQAYLIQTTAAALNPTWSGGSTCSVNIVSFLPGAAAGALAPSAFVRQAVNRASTY